MVNGTAQRGVDDQVQARKSVRTLSHVLSAVTSVTYLDSRVVEDDRAMLDASTYYVLFILFMNVVTAA